MSYTQFLVSRGVSAVGARQALTGQAITSPTDRLLLQRVDRAFIALHGRAARVTSRPVTVPAGSVRPRAVGSRETVVATRVSAIPPSSTAGTHLSVMARRIELETQQRYASMQAEIDSLRLKIAQLIDRINQMMEHLDHLIKELDSNRNRMTQDQIKEQELKAEVVMLQIERLREQFERLEGRLTFLLAQVASSDSHSRTR